MPNTVFPSTRQLLTSALARSLKHSYILEAMESTARARKPKAPTLRDADWAPHKEHIVQLHITDNIPLKDVKVIMERDYGFVAEIRQYRTRLSKWKLDKNVKTREMKSIIRKSQHRDLVQTAQRSLRFKIRDQEVEREKVTRWMRAHDVDERQPYAPSSAACAFCCLDESPLLTSNSNTVCSGVLDDVRVQYFRPKHTYTDTNPDPLPKPVACQCHVD
ncbi:Clr5 domain-containing protein [Boeremia exigua]|uniref:Clr5 domain-containing protein n=1 Tax=Boeremia exigua TaxID=749465 RepID=UPI001E8ED721|nr:Clr5 domain-containing protein [Boeremia exigua]KAH6613895.1 Clr5 domain-containing protein [Boeremia exigua]